MSESEGDDSRDQAVGRRARVNGRRLGRCVMTLEVDHVTAAFRKFGSKTNGAATDDVEHKRLQETSQCAGQALRIASQQ